MEAAGLVKNVSLNDATTKFWRLSLHGVRSAVPRFGLVSFRLVFALRDEPLLKMRDRTDYELFLLLKRDGWTWGEWKTVKQRRKKDPIIPIGYEKDAEKMWYSTGGGAPRSYLLCLCEAEDHYIQASGDALLFHAHVPVWCFSSQHGHGWC